MCILKFILKYYLPLIGYLILFKGWCSMCSCHQPVSCYIRPQMKAGQKPVIIEKGTMYCVMCEVNMLVMLIGLSDPSKCYSMWVWGVCVGGWSWHFTSFRIIAPVLTLNPLLVWWSYSSAAQSHCLQIFIINRTGLTPPTHQFRLIT